MTSIKNVFKCTKSVFKYTFMVKLCPDHSNSRAGKGKMLVDRCYSDRGAIKTLKAEREINSYAPCLRNPDQSRKSCAGPLWAGEITVGYILLLL